MVKFKNVGSKFFVEPKGRGNTKISLKSRQIRSQLKSHFDKAAWNKSIVNMNDSESIRRAASIDLSNL